MKKSVILCTSLLTSVVSLWAVADPIASINTKVVGYTSISTLCKDVSLITIPLTVDKPTQVYANANIFVKPSDVSDTTMYVAVMDSSKQIIGVTYGPIGTGALSAAGLVHEGKTPLDPVASTLILSSGEYTINLMVQTNLNFKCSSFSYKIEGGVLSYFLVDATNLDRIFKNGFEVGDADLLREQVV